MRTARGPRSCGSGRACPESSTLNSALMRNLPFHAAPSSSATDGSFGGVELAQIDRVDEALLLDGLQQRQHAGPVKSSTTAPPSPASCTSRWASPAGSVIGHVLEDADALHAVLLGEVDHAAVDRRRSRASSARRRRSCPSAPARTRGLGAAEARVVRAHVDGREVRAGEARLVDAGDDRVEALLGVVVPVDAAVDDAGVADEAEHARPVSISFVASEAICCGSICSSSAMYSIGRPLMPPLSFTQSK